MKKLSGPLSLSILPLSMLPLSILLLSMLLVACNETEVKTNFNEDDSASNPDLPDGDPRLSKGIFAAGAPVMNLAYDCEHGNRLNKRTTTDTTLPGQFSCKAGDVVTFYLGSNSNGTRTGLVLGSVIMEVGMTVTPVELVAYDRIGHEAGAYPYENSSLYNYEKTPLVVPADITSNDRQASNITALLESLDTRDSDVATTDSYVSRSLTNLTSIPEVVHTRIVDAAFADLRVATFTYQDYNTIFSPKIADLLQVLRDDDAVDLVDNGTVLAQGSASARLVAVRKVLQSGLYYSPLYLQSFFGGVNGCRSTGGQSCSEAQSVDRMAGGAKLYVDRYGKLSGDGLQMILEVASTEGKLKGRSFLWQAGASIAENGTLSALQANYTGAYTGDTASFQGRIVRGIVFPNKTPGKDSKGNSLLPGKFSLSDTDLGTWLHSENTSSSRYWHGDFVLQQKGALPVYLDRAVWDAQPFPIKYQFVLKRPRVDADGTPIYDQEDTVPASDATFRFSILKDGTIISDKDNDCQTVDATTLQDSGGQGEVAIGSVGSLLKRDDGTFATLLMADMDATSPFAGYAFGSFPGYSAEVADQAGNLLLRLKLTAGADYLTLDAANQDGTGTRMSNYVTDTIAWNAAAADLSTLFTTAENYALKKGTGALSGAVCVPKP